MFWKLQILQNIVWYKKILQVHVLEITNNDIYHNSIDSDKFGYHAH